MSGPEYTLYCNAPHYVNAVVDLVQFVACSNAKVVPGANRTKDLAEFFLSNTPSAAASICDSTHDERLVKY